VNGVSKMKRINDDRLTYISLFSSAGVGCYGFKMHGFECIATNEIVERRINVQKFNEKCKYETGYICGDITEESVKQHLLGEVERWRKVEKIGNVTVIIATPPCQGMSVANHKKADNEIVRNSLVIESIKIIEEISPLFFVFENVPAFMKTICTDTDGAEKPISEAIEAHLGSKYATYSQVINFKNYGACSSRSRTVVIGVRKDLADFISPFELFPDYQEEKTLREVIGHLPALQEFGEISKSDIYHAFRVYPEHMRSWIADLKEGESAFDQSDISKVPHKVVDGEIVVNIRKNGDKYRRQYWDKVGPCIHTRNDQLASQNTIHPSDDRVFSIRELMMMMTIPSSFRWTNIPEQTLNSLSIEKKRAFLKKEEIKIRQCLGEAVPTAIFESIADKIAFFFSRQHLSDVEVKKLIDTTDLGSLDSVINYISANFDTVGISSISKVVEYANAKREHNAAFFTDKSILNEIMKYLPDIDKDSIRILEPSVGTGNFIPFIIKKYAAAKSVIIDVVDIDPDVIAVLKYIISKFALPDNVTINYINDDFLLHKFNMRYDMVIGNPPFNKLGSNNKALKLYKAQAVNTDTTNTFSFFLEKAIQISDYVSLIVPKFLLNTPEFRKTREVLEKKHIDSIIDFGENGFKGVLVETVCVNVNTLESAAKTIIRSMTEQVTFVQKQSYITDSAFPYWLIYRNEFFDKIAKRLTFDVFTVFRDRQITNKLLSTQGDIRVIKSRNINDLGTQIESIEGYDSYISADDARQLSVYAFYESDNVYLTPNMTYKPRLIKKPPYALVNGSVAILTLKDGFSINEMQRGYFSTDEYRAFYKIARNYQTRSLNVDSNSVFFFGLLKEV
jgi:DNA (cytosine-5)-methyltransferase 1